MMIPGAHHLHMDGSSSPDLVPESPPRNRHLPPVARKRTGAMPGRAASAAHVGGVIARDMHATTSGDVGLATRNKICRLQVGTLTGFDPSSSQNAVLHHGLGLSRSWVRHRCVHPARSKLRNGEGRIPASACSGTGVR
jgi:hypothetical protein